ncbi:MULTISPECIES: DUF485 domain-containing protein [Saccharopolyspora]|uniref:DUF485 domain-containing protein n=1 Tax=Saccharopolyspora cebuensis TaxID=418759 RepID=A0ABV4CIT0_9PSEU
MSNATQSALRGKPRDQAGKTRTTFGGIDKSSVRQSDAPVDFTAIQQSAEFQALRRRVKWFVFPATAFFLIWYLSYVALAAYAPEFMATPVFGEVNAGLLLGIGQFVTTVALTSLYVAFAQRRVDPAVDEIRRNAGGADR